jgi:GNAT superfamily N-acetyltransferase
MAPAVRIRPVAPTDLDAWLPLWDGYNAFYGRTGPTALPREVTDTTWARFFDPYEPVHALVAERDGGLVGVTHFLLHRSTTSIAPSCYLQDLFTDEAARGAGVGRALIEAVTDWARTAGAARLYWQTQESNRTARRLYDRMATLTGFVVYARPVG